MQISCITVHLPTGSIHISRYMYMYQPTHWLIWQLWLSCLLFSITGRSSLLLTPWRPLSLSLSLSLSVRQTLLFLLFQLSLTTTRRCLIFVGSFSGSDTCVRATQINLRFLEQFLCISFQDVVQNAHSLDEEELGVGVVIQHTNIHPFIPMKS